MKVKSLAKLSDIKLKGIKVEGTLEGSTIHRLTLTDENGEFVEIKADYGTHVYVKAPPTKVTQHNITGKIADVPIDEKFDDEFEAKNRFEKLKSLNADDLEIKKIEVEVI